MVSTGGVLKDLPDYSKFHPALRIAARVISFLFHPLFLPLYVAWFLIFEANLFPERTHWQKTIVLIQFFVYYTFLPLMTTVIAKALGFVSSIYLKTQKDRILPYIVCEIFYFWGWYVFKNFKSPPFPREVVMFALGVFLASCGGMIMNAFFKISMHAISVGVVATFFVLAGFMTDANYGFYISAAFLIAGLTATARLIDSNHSTTEIYAGFFMGLLAQLLAAAFV